MTISRRKKQRLRLLNSLKEKATLNFNRGKLLADNYPRWTRKDRRHNGRKYPHCPYPQKLLDQLGIFIDYYWDDWLEYRDGFRDRSRICGCLWWDDLKENIPLMRAKLKKQLKIRKARKMKRFINSENINLYGNYS